MNTIQQAAIKAYEDYNVCGNMESFEQWLEKMKQAGFYWSA